MAPSHYLNQCWNIVNWTLRNKLQWNFNRNSNIFIRENALENGVCEMASSLSRPQCVKTDVVNNCGSWALLFEMPGWLPRWTFYVDWRKINHKWCLHWQTSLPFFCIKELLWPLLPTWLNPVWKSNHMLCKVWDKITCPSPNFSGTTIEV